MTIKRNKHVAVRFSGDESNKLIIEATDVELLKKVAEDLDSYCTYIVEVYHIKRLYAYCNPDLYTCESIVDYIDSKYNNNTWPDTMHVTIPVSPAVRIIDTLFGMDVVCKDSETKYSVINILKMIVPIISVTDNTLEIVFSKSTMDKENLQQVLDYVLFLYNNGYTSATHFEDENTIMMEREN